MSTTDPKSLLGLSCPDGGSFYICKGAKIQFLGCCSQDPCADGSGDCPQDALASASYNKDNYGDIPPQSCAAPYDNNTWYTCQNAVPPFIGCCSSVPCNGGCPDADLLAARVGDDPADAAVFLNGTTTSPSSTSSSSTRTSATATSTSTSSPTSTAAAEGSSSSSLSTGGIIGASIGGSLGIIALLGFLLLCYKRTNKRKREQYRGPIHPSPNGMGMPSPYQDSFSSPNFPQASQFGGSQYGSDNATALSGEHSIHNRASSQTLAPSWISGHSHSGHPSISGSEFSYNGLFAHQKPEQQHLHPVSEIDGIEMASPPPSELAGTEPAPRYRPYRPG